MKILHITPSYKPAFIYGGPTVSVSRLCEELSRLNNSVEVYTTTANGKEELAVETGKKVDVDGVEVTYFKRMTGDHTHFSPSLLYALWKKGHHYDVIHIHAWWNLISVFALLICRLKGWRPYLAPRGMLSRYAFEHENSLKKKLIHSTLGKRLLKYSILHATTALEVRDAQRIIPNWEYIVLPNIVKLQTNSYPRQSKEDKKLLELVFLSRVDPKKGLGLLFDALARVNFPYHLHIYGNRQDYYENKLKDLASDIGIAKYLSWHGWVEGEKKFKVLSEAELFVLTSYNENFANVVLESLSVSTPVLISDQVGLAEYVQENSLGWVCNTQIEDIVDKLNLSYESLIATDTHTFQINRQTILREFDGQAIAEKYLNAYKSCKC